MSVSIVAEVAQAHDGSLGILHSYIDASAAAGVDAVKFQVHIAEAESSALEPFRKPFSLVDKTRYDYWRRVSFTPAQWAGVKEHCERAGVEFLASPFSVQAARLLERLGVRRYKIASGEVEDFLMLDFVARTGKELWISTGMSSYDETDAVMSFLRPFGNRVVLLQCASVYPASAEDTGLNVLAELRERYGVDVGLSDHSGTVYPSLAAVTLGAVVVEAHIVFDRRMFGPDAASSLTVDEFAGLVKGVRFLETALANPLDKQSTRGLSELKKMFGKSLSVVRDIPAGQTLALDDLESRKPAGEGIPARDFRRVVGARAAHALTAGAFIREADLHAT
jgi:N,N'-diacetyllegionaminate synthase